MYSNKLYTPLRYPGGKARFAALIESVIRSNGLSGGHYFEPYAGGAGLALILLLDGVVDCIHINDADPAVAVFWRGIVGRNAELCRMVANAEVSIDAWHHWRGVMRGGVAASELERAFATLFLNRTNRSGILKGGVIGGKGQDGAYKLDARFMRDEICTRIQRIGRVASKIFVYEQDAYDLLKKCHQFLPKRSLVYLDPPYYVKGAGLYRNFYQHEDHRRISRLVVGDRFRRPWVVSYDNAPQIRTMYSAARSVIYGLNYTVQVRYVGEEVMFFSDRLKQLNCIEPISQAA